MVLEPLPLARTGKHWLQAPVITPSACGTPGPASPGAWPQRRTGAAAGASPRADDAGQPVIFSRPPADSPIEFRREHLDAAFDRVVYSALGGWEELTPDQEANRLDRIIVYSTIANETFTLPGELKKAPGGQGGAF